MTSFQWEGKCIDLCIPIIKEINWKWISVIVNLRD